LHISGFFLSCNVQPLVVYTCSIFGFVSHSSLINTLNKIPKICFVRSVYLVVFAHNKISHFFSCLDFSFYATLNTVWAICFYRPFWYLFNGVFIVFLVVSESSIKKISSDFGILCSPFGCIYILINIMYTYDNWCIMCLNILIIVCNNKF
jgi:hypothetical protein